MSYTERPRRSALYLPASNAKAIAKARTLPADIVILDLEDAVAPEAKEEARAAAVAALEEGGFGPEHALLSCFVCRGRDELLQLLKAGQRVVKGA